MLSELHERLPTDYVSARRDFALELPEELNFGFDVIDAHPADAPAFIFVPNDGREAQPFSYGELAERSNRFAEGLLALGAQKGDGVFVMLPRVPAFYDTLIGCCKAGVVAMPGTNLLTAKDIAYRINRAEARFAVVAAEHVEKLDAIRAQCPTLEHTITVDPGAGDSWHDLESLMARATGSLSRADAPVTRQEDPMLVYFTSGTTAYPKMVPRNHAYAFAHVITGKYWLDLRPGGVHWTLTDTGWAKAAWGLLYPPFLARATTVLYQGGPKFDPVEHLQIIQALGVETFCAPPTVYRLFAQHDLSQYDLSGIRHSLSAGEPLNPEAIRVWEDATGTKPHDGYGQTETVCLVCNHPGIDVRPGSMGKPTPGLEVDVVDEGGKVTDIDTIGHIAVRTNGEWPPGLFRGYLDDDGTNDQVFRNGWYYTGDTATRDADGYIWFVGRADDVILSAGYRISPFEVESTLQEHPAVAESAVVGKPDDTRGQIVKAFVVLAAGFEADDAMARELQRFVREQTAAYKYPREIEFQAELPKTISGKIRRVELRDEA
ncbi:MAG: AMP-binding protein [Myxococcota bacterium]